MGFLESHLQGGTETGPLLNERRAHGLRYGWGEEDKFPNFLKIMPVFSLRCGSYIRYSEFRA